MICFCTGMWRSRGCDVVWSSLIYAHIKCSTLHACHWATEAENTRPSMGDQNCDASGSKLQMTPIANTTFCSSSEIWYHFKAIQLIYWEYFLRTSLLLASNILESDGYDLLSLNEKWFLILQWLLIFSFSTFWRCGIFHFLPCFWTVVFVFVFVFFLSIKK